jgi:hypothetical protein
MSLPIPTMLKKVVSTPLKAKPAGDISSVFPSLSGAKFVPLPDRFVDVQKRIIEGRQTELKQSWERLLVSLDQEINDLNPHSAIPIINIEDLTVDEYGITQFSPQAKSAIKAAGVAVIRNVIPAEQVLQYKHDVQDYIRVNPVKGFPAENPSVFELYWSPSQLKARAHPNLLKVQQALLQLWHGDNKAPISLKHPVSYADRLRIRPPGDAKFALGPHIDGGTVERWEDEEYSEVYRSIFAGNWEQYDPFDYTHRLYATSDMYQGASACSMFRMFQGWLSMSSTGPGEGTLQVCPLLKHATAYSLLRPFFAPESALDNTNANCYDERNNDLSSKWKFVAPTNVFPGSSLGAAQELNDQTHPHLVLRKSMVSIPRVEPGDYVVWHCDTIHAVESLHNGANDSSVMYIPAAPLCETNLMYLARQRANFRQLIPAPDFPGGDGEQGFAGTCTDKDVDTEAGKLAFGIGEIPYTESAGVTEGEKAVLSRANKVLYQA